MSEQYFVDDTSTQASGEGTWVQWDALKPFELMPGLTFQPVLGEGIMVNFVTFQPHTEVPVHWHDEEQVTYVMDGEFEFEVAGEVRTMRRGDAVVIPPNVPHGARTHDGPCLEIDVFHPPRQGVIDAMGL